MISQLPFPGSINVGVTYPPIVTTIQLIFDQTTLPVNGFFMYIGFLTLPIVSGVTTSTMTWNFRIFNQRPGTTVLGTTWIDDFVVEYLALPGEISGDPQFSGLRGQNYQVHGIDGEVYNLVSSATTQVNSRFVFLIQGRCPVQNDIPARNCWSHAGSYLGEIGITQVVNGLTYKLAIVSGSYASGFDSVTLNNDELSVGHMFDDTSLFSVSFDSSHQLTVRTAEFAFKFENSDMFINQIVSATKPLSQLTAHGLIGQTHKLAMYSNSLKHIAGEVDDYVIEEGHLFGERFVFNQFHAAP